MKHKLVFITSSLFALSLTLVSCVRTHECECIRTYEDGSSDSKIHVYESKQEWAEETCNSYDVESTRFTEECELK